MTTLSKDHLNKLVRRPETMNLDELLGYGTTVSISNIDDKAVRAINNAIDRRRAYLNEDTSGMVVNSIVSAEEMRDD